MTAGQSTTYSLAAGFRHTNPGTEPVLPGTPPGRQRRWRGGCFGLFLDRRARRRCISYCRLTAPTRYHVRDTPPTRGGKLYKDKQFRLRLSVREDGQSKVMKIRSNSCFRTVRSMAFKPVRKTSENPLKPKLQYWHTQREHLTRTTTYGIGIGTSNEL